MIEQPGDYRQQFDKKPATGKLRDRLRDAEDRSGGGGSGAPGRKKPLTKDAEKRLYAEKVAERLAFSKTRKFLNGIFGLAYIVLLIELVVFMAGMANSIQSVASIPLFFKYPVLKLWNPDPSIGDFMGIMYPRANVPAMLIYGVIHWLLLQVHRVVTEDRVRIA